MSNVDTEQETPTSDPATGLVPGEGADDGRKPETVTARRNRQYVEEMERRARQRIEAAQAKGCPVCLHSAEHGWHGPDTPTRSHCRKCCRGWNSLREAHCPACCAHFANDAAATKHQTAQGCNDPEHVLRRDGKPRFRVRTGPHGTTWALAFYGDRPAHWGTADHDDRIDEDPDDACDDPAA